MASLARLAAPLVTLAVLAAVAVGLARADPFGGVGTAGDVGKAGDVGTAAVTVTDRRGDVVAREPLPRDGAFALTYRHSVYDVPARERFAALPDGGFRLLGVSSPSEAVLDYYGLAGTRQRRGGWWHLELGEPSLHDGLPLIATAHGRRTLEVSGTAIALYPSEGSRHIVVTTE